MTVLEVCFVLICVYKCVPVLTFPSPLSLSNADGESRHDDGASAQRVLFYPLPVVVEASEVDNVLSKNPDELQQMLLEKQSDNALLPLNLPDNIIQKITDILKHPITMDLDTDAENSLGSVNAGNLFVSSTSESPESVTFFTDELHDERVSSVSVPVPVSVSREMEAPTSVSQTTTESTYVPSYVTKIPTPTHQETIKPPVKLLKRLLSDYLPVVNQDVRDSKRPEKNSVISSLASKRLKTAPSMKYPVFGDGQFMSLLNTLNVILNRKVLPPSETYEPFKAPTYNVSFPHFTVNVSETMFESPVIDHHTPAPKATTSSNFWSTVVTQSPSPPRSQYDSTPNSHTIKYISQSTVSPFIESHPLSISWTTISKSPSTLTSSISPIPSQNAVSQTEKTSSVVDINPETSSINTPITGPPYDSKPDNDGLEHLSTASVKAWSSTFSPLLQHSDNFQIDDKIGIFSSSEPLPSIYQHEITHSNNYNLIDGADTTSPPTDSYPTFSSASLDNEQDTGTYHTTEEEVKTTSPESYFESTPDQDETSSTESYPYEPTQAQDETSSPETFSYESTQTQDETLSTESYLHESTQNQDEASSESYPYESTQNQEEDASEIFAINTHSTDVDCVSHTTQLLSTLSYEGETDTTQHSEQSLLLETTEISTFTDAVTTDEYHEDSDCDGDKESDTTQELSSTLIFEGETTETSTSIDNVTTDEYHEDSDCDGEKVSDTTQELSSTLIFEGETTETSTFTDAVTTEEYHEDSDCDGEKVSDTTQELFSTLIFEGETDTAEHSEQSSLPETTETSTSIDNVTTDEYHEDIDCDDDKIHFDKKINRELVSDVINTVANPTDNQTESEAEKYEESSEGRASVKTTQIYHQPTTESEPHPDIVYGSSQPTIFDDTETTTVSVSEGEPQSLFLDVKPVSEDIDEEPMTPFSLATSSVSSTGNKVNAETATIVMISTGDDEEEEIDDPLNCDTSNGSTSAVNEEVMTSTLDQKTDLTTEGQVSETGTLSLSDSSETATKSFDNEDLPISEDLNEIGDEQDYFRRGKNSKLIEDSSSDDEHWSDDDQHSTVNSSSIDDTEKIGFQTGDSDTKTKDLINSEILRKRSENFPNLEEEPISSENFEDGLDETYDPPKIEQKKIPDELKEIQASESMVISSETSAEKLMSLLSKQLDNEGVESEEEDGDYEIDGAGMKIVKNGQRKGKWIEDLSNDELVALMESMKSRNS